MSIFDDSIGSVIIDKKELEKLMIIFLWQAEEISEGKAAEALGWERMEVRALRDEFIKDALAKFEKMHPHKQEPVEVPSSTTITLLEWMKEELATQKKFGEMMYGNHLSANTERLKSEFIARFADSAKIQLPEKCVEIEVFPRSLSELRHNPKAQVSINYQAEKGAVSIKFSKELEYFMENDWPVWKFPDDLFDKAFDIDVYHGGFASAPYSYFTSLLATLENCVHGYGLMAE